MTPTQEPASPSRPMTLADDPLLLLVTGPLSPEELLDKCNSQVPEVPESEHRQTLENLYNQHDQKKLPLVPKWWQGSPDQFVQKMNGNLTLLRFSKNETQAVRQSQTLEVLLNMWSEHFYGGTDWYTPGVTG